MPFLGDDGRVDLFIAPGPGVPAGLTVPAGLLVERFARSSGPGGQGVNTTDSRVQLVLKVEGCPAFTEAQQRRIIKALGPRLVDGHLTVDASEERSQLRNRQLARERMASLLRTALAPEPPQRRATRPTRGSVMRRRLAKAHRSEIKRGRSQKSDS